MIGGSWNELFVLFMYCTIVIGGSWNKVLVQYCEWVRAQRAEEKYTVIANRKTNSECVTFVPVSYNSMTKGASAKKNIANRKPTARVEDCACILQLYDRGCERSEPKKKIANRKPTARVEDTCLQPTTL